MTALYKSLSLCRSCHSQDLENVIDFGETAIADDYSSEKSIQPTYPLCVALCGACGLLQLRHAIDLSIIYDNYIYSTSSSPGLKQHFSDYAQEVYQYLELDPAKLVLDIGCNDGVLIEAFKAIGCRVSGIEPSFHTTQSLRDKGIDIFVGYWGTELRKEITKKFDKVDVITANNMFANVDDIRGFTENVSAALNEDGVFVIETGSHLALIDNFVFDNIYHEHLSYFSVLTLGHFFSQFGMEVFHVSKVDTKGGSIRVFVGFKDKHQKSPELLSHIEEEKYAGLFEVATYQRYMNRIEALRIQVQQQLTLLKDSGVKLVGFGASATCTTVIYALGISDFLSYLVDDNPIKQNTYSPGFRIPVQSSEVLVDDPESCVVILPWRFGEMFIDANRQHLAAGGTFLKIMPDIELID